MPHRSHRPFRSLPPVINEEQVNHDCIVILGPQISTYSIALLIVHHIAHYALSIVALYVASFIDPYAGQCDKTGVLFLAASFPE